MFTVEQLAKIEEIKKKVSNIPTLAFDEKYKTLDIDGTNHSVADLNMANLTSAQINTYGNFFADAPETIEFLLECIDQLKR